MTAQETYTIRHLNELERSGALALVGRSLGARALEINLAELMPGRRCRRATGPSARRKRCCSP